MTSATLKTLSPEDLAVLLHRSVSTIKTDCRRRPQTLPPRLRIPGSTRLMWLEADVLDWLEKFREKTK
jgi:hypothetical protein